MKPELIKSPLNYTGGKYRLLPQILPLFPAKIETFVDLFCGGANVGINVSAKNVTYNDKNLHLIGLYNFFERENFPDIANAVNDTIRRYGLSDSKSFGYTVYGCESSKGLGSYNRGGYLKLRSDFNSMKKRDNTYYLSLFVLIIFSFNNQIRFNQKGEFNLPVGKRDFNLRIENNLEKFMNALHERQNNFISKDFEELDPASLKKGDFVYCDPPYLLGEASYNESGGWGPRDEERLLEYLDALNSLGIKFALSNVLEHKGKENAALKKWAENYSLHYMDFNYKHSSYHLKKTGSSTEEVLITNY